MRLTSRYSPLLSQIEGLVHLHATRERDQKIAAGMGRLFADAKKTSKTGTEPKPSGTQRARRPKRAS